MVVPSIVSRVSPLAEANDGVRMEQQAAIIHCRVSHPNQRHRTASLTNQAAFGSRFAILERLEIVRITEEIASGASLWNRPLLARDRAAIHAGQAHALIVTDADRLTRNFVHLAIVIEACHRAGAEVLAVNEPLPSAQDMLLLPGNANDFARLERERVRDRMLQGKRGRALAGKLFNAGVDKYGYRRDKQRGIRVIYAPESQVVQQIFAWVTLDRLTFGEILRRLNGAVIPPPSVGKLRFSDPERTPRWGRGQLHRILTDPAYKGQTVAWRWKHVGRNRYPLERPADEWIMLPDGVTPGIVSAEMWDVAQERVSASQRTQRENQQKAKRYLLSGHVWCAVCGRRMYAEPHGGEPVYRCASRQTASGKCGGVQVHAPALETWVWTQVMMTLANRVLLQAHVDARRASLHDPVLEGDHVIVQDFAALLGKRQERLTAYLNRAAHDGMSTELVQREVGYLEQVGRHLQDAEQEIEACIARIQQPVIRLERLLGLSTTQDSSSYTFDQQRLALEALGVRVITNGRQWQLRYEALDAATVVAET